MSDINEVRAVLECSAEKLDAAGSLGNYIRALLADHARLHGLIDGQADLASMRAHMAAVPVLIEAVRRLPDAEQVFSQWDKARAFQPTKVECEW